MSSLILEGKHIILWCRNCKKSTLHETIIKDEDTGKWRQPQQKPKTNYNAQQKSMKYNRRCVECGNIVKF